MTRGLGIVTDAAAIFVVGNIPDVMRHIFNATAPSSDGREYTEDI